MEKCPYCGSPLDYVVYNETIENSYEVSCHGGKELLESFVVEEWYECPDCGQPLEETDLPATLTDFE